MSYSGVSLLNYNTVLTRICQQSNMSQENKKRRFSDSLSDVIAYMGGYFTAEENLDHNMPETNGLRFYRKIHPSSEVEERIRKGSMATSEGSHEGGLNNVEKLEKVQKVIKPSYRAPVGQQSPMLYGAIRVESQKSMYQSLGGRIY